MTCPSSGPDSDLNELDFARAMTKLPFVPEHIRGLIGRTEDERLLRSLACRCARLALGKCRTPDERLRSVVGVCERHAHGQASPGELQAAREVADSVAEEAAKAFQSSGDPLEGDESSLQESHEAYLLRCVSSMVAACASPSAYAAAV